MFIRNTEPSSKVLSLILSAYANLSAEWLMRGSGDMYLQKEDMPTKYDAEVEVCNGVITIKKK